MTPCPVPSAVPPKRPAVKAEPKGEADAKRPRAKITYEDASEEEEEEEKKPKATTKRAAAAKKKAVEESEEEDSDDDKPIAKKAWAAPAPKRAAAKVGGARRWRDRLWLVNGVALMIPGGTFGRVRVAKTAPALHKCSGSRAKLGKGKEG